MRKAVQILSPLVGIVFLVSGIGKAVATHEFSNLLTQYGSEEFRFLAPLIIVFEVALGLALFFAVRQRLVSLLALCFIIVLSLAYLYGNLFVNVTDCGCFGQFSFLNMPPLFTFLRNIVLCGMLLYIFLKSDNSHKTVGKTEVIIVTCIMSVLCFTIGYTYNNYSASYESKAVNIPVDNSVLGEFITPSKDSTYLVFAFSYTCPHCYNSIENLKQYERLGVVDKVLAMSFVRDSVAMENFNRVFELDFTPKNYPPEQLFRLTKEFPTSYYIQNNIVKMEIRGTLPCGYLLQQQLSNYLKIRKTAY